MAPYKVYQQVNGSKFNERPPSKVGERLLRIKNSVNVSQQPASNSQEQIRIHKVQQTSFQLQSTNQPITLPVTSTNLPIKSTGLEIKPTGPAIKPPTSQIRPNSPLTFLVKSTSYLNSNIPQETEKEQAKLENGLAALSIEKRTNRATEDKTFKKSLPASAFPNLEFNWRAGPPPSILAASAKIDTKPATSSLGLKSEPLTPPLTPPSARASKKVRFDCTRLYVIPALRKRPAENSTSTPIETTESTYFPAEVANSTKPAEIVKTPKPTEVVTPPNQTEEEVREPPKLRRPYIDYTLEVKKEIEANKLKQKPWEVEWFKPKDQWTSAVRFSS